MMGNGMENGPSTPGDGQGLTRQYPGRINSNPGCEIKAA